MSMQRNPVGWFEIPIKEMARAKSFYEHVFTLDLEEHQTGSLLMAWFPMEEGVTGAAGSLVKGARYEPSNKGVLVYFTAPDIDNTLARLKEKGGTVFLKRPALESMDPLP